MARLFALGFAAGAVLTGLVFWLRPGTSPILMTPDLPPVLDLALLSLCFSLFGGFWVHGHAEQQQGWKRLGHLVLILAASLVAAAGLGGMTLAMKYWYLGTLPTATLLPDLACATLEGLQWGPRLFANSQPLSSMLALSAGWLLHRFASVRV